MSKKPICLKPILLFLSWRDIYHPQSGGAEVFTTQMLNRSELKNKYRFIHFSTHVRGKKTVSQNHHIIYINKGNWFTVLFHAFLFYFRFRNRIKFVIDQCNTHRFFTPLWVAKKKQVFFIHQLTREIWKIKFPNFLGTLGEVTENFMFRMYRCVETLTVSQSTKNDLEEIGFKDQKINIIPEGVSHRPLNFPLPEKRDHHLFIYVGRYSEYKGLPDATKAYIEYLKIYPNAQFLIIGKKNNTYIEKILKPLCEASNIKLAYQFNQENNRTMTLLGRVSESEKLYYMEKATALIYPSRREGWGLGVTEAAILGTPSIVYHSPGLIDAVDQGQAGFLCHENSAKGILKKMLLLNKEPELYSKTRNDAYEYSSQFRWENTAKAFDSFIRRKENA